MSLETNMEISNLFERLVMKEHYRFEIEFIAGFEPVNEKFKKLVKDLQSGIREVMSDVKVFKKEWIRILSTSEEVSIFFKAEGVSLYAYAKVVRQVLSKCIVDDENKRVFIPLNLEGMQFPADERWDKDHIYDIKIQEWTTAGVNNAFKEVCCGVEND